MSSIGPGCPSPAPFLTELADGCEDDQNALPAGVTYEAVAGILSATSVVLARRTLLGSMLQREGTRGDGLEYLILPILKALVLVPVTLLPIINPLSTAPVFVATVGNNRALAARLARQIAINSWVVIVTSMLIGTYVLALFGISLPIVRLGGGLLVASTAWRMLHRTDDDAVHAKAAEETCEMTQSEVVRRSFFPITFPLTTGPGTIAASIALGAQIPTTPVLYLAGVMVAASGALLVSLALYLIFRNSTAVVAWLGEVGMLVLTRLMAFILLCIGLQIMWYGWAELHTAPM